MPGDELALTRRLSWRRFPNAGIDPSRTVLCVPGYAASGESFARLSPLAHRFDFRMLTFDESADDHRSNLIGELVDEVVQYSRAFDHPVLLGISFGGLVVIRAAASLGDRAGGLVLVSTLIRENRDRLATIRVPALVIQGGRDPIVSAESGAELARSLPFAELAVIAGAGHLPHLTHAPEVMLAMNAFLERVFCASESVCVE